MKEKFKPLKFGTSGLRDTVVNMTDMECYINSKGFISFLAARGEISSGGDIALGGDLRFSTPRIMASVAQAITDSGYNVICCGRVPSPTLAYYAIDKGIPSVMVTGSHIPDDRNGIKFTKTSGEVLKSDEKDILGNVAKCREDEYAIPEKKSLFTEDSMFKDPHPALAPEFENEAVEKYIARYREAFPKDVFKGKKIVLYQHSAVGRDIILRIFENLGAEVIPAGRSDKFVPVDTEKISEETRSLLESTAKEYKSFAVISTDGDSDRPLLADENGSFLPGDKLGALVSIFLKPDFAAIPISANDAVVSALKKSGVTVEQTKIGSPYVIKAMNDELEKTPDAKVVSWESNGGYLLGSGWSLEWGNLTALPTRDAVLPLIAALSLAVREQKTVSALISDALPARYTHADVADNKTPGCETYTPEMGKDIVEKFSAKDNIGELERYFNPENGFGTVASVNLIDGVRIVFSSGDVVHLRPSGNAPEFRIYATADSVTRAEEIVEKAKRIIPNIIRSAE